ncbi:carbohydrate ABC transporter permease [Murimonas intestini]|uniref:Raffinose/stachyose/melibiose transport system permease protein n=1 Tax=Murimonas intestini TaxID=1337051 RepID=A0AB73SZM9_9FIRM|nr:sugar ABC transporter permease [Murimonas intestini]MCR1842836.1 sugar ABC transporter permease [Murimonas intestini]MCR1867825.1 sugar ABC transporter permease [Murimonas intestini]MCR1885176.1 sugar ABC transporter permease [Murimonas intestini]
MRKNKIYHVGFVIPLIIVFTAFFLVPMVISLYFSMTVWNFDSAKFCGLKNYITFFTTKSLWTGVKNTLIYALLGSGGITVLAFMLAAFLTSRIRTKNFIRSAVFFPNLVSAIAVGITFTAMMHPTKGIINKLIEFLGGTRINFLGDTKTALFSVILVLLWKGLSIATVIYVAGITSIDTDYYEAAAIDGANGWARLVHITVPLCRSSINTVILLSVIGSFRNFDLMWAMTGGGPGYATDNMASIVYKQYAAGFYGLSTAGNVVLFLIIAVLIFPLQKLLNWKKEV